jgi:hypothetical protein
MLGFRFSVSKDRYYHATLQIFPVELTDAAKELADVVGLKDEEYFRNRLLVVKSANETGGTVYCREAFHARRVEFKWQANISPDDPPRDHGWYGGQCELALHPETVKLLKRIIGATERFLFGNTIYRDYTPAAIIHGIRANKSETLMHVRYSNDNYDMWLIDPKEPAQLEHPEEEIPA